jgi:hypothetical protein
MNTGASTSFRLVKSGRFIVDYVLLENTKERLMVEVITNLDLTQFLTFGGGNIKTRLLSGNGALIQEVTSTAPIAILQRNNIIDNTYAITNNYNPSPNIGRLTDYTYNITDITMSDNDVGTKFNIKYLLNNSYQVTFNNLSLNPGDEIYIESVLSTYPYVNVANQIDFKIEVFESKYTKKTRTIQKGDVIDISNGYTNIIKGKTHTSLSTLDFFVDINYFDYTYSYSSSSSNIIPNTITPQTSNYIQTTNWGMYSDNDDVSLFLTNTAGFKAKVCDLTKTGGSTTDDTEVIPNAYRPFDAYRIRRNCDINGVNYFNNIQPSDISLADYYYPLGKLKHKWSTDFTLKRKYEYYYEKVINDTKTILDYKHEYTYPEYTMDDGNGGLLTVPSGVITLNMFTINSEFYSNFIDPNNSSIAPTTTAYRRPLNSAFVGTPLLKSKLSINNTTGDLVMDTNTVSGRKLMVNSEAKTLGDISITMHSYSGPEYVFNNPSIIDNNTINNHTPLSKWKISNNTITYSSYIHPFVVDYNTDSLVNFTYYNGINDDGIGATLSGVLVTILTFPVVVKQYQTLTNIIPGVTIGSKVLVNLPSSNISFISNGIYIVNNIGNTTTPWVMTRDSSYDTNFDIIGSVVYHNISPRKMYVNNKDAAVLGKKGFVYSLVTTNPPGIATSFEDYFGKTHANDNNYYSNSNYLNDCLNASLKDYPLMPNAVTTNEVVFNIPNVFDIADNPNCVKYLLEFESGTKFLVDKNDDSSTIGSTSQNTTVAYSNFFVKRQNYKAYYTGSTTFTNLTTIAQPVPNTVINLNNALIKYNTHRMYGAYRMTSGVESLGFVQEANSSTENNFYTNSGILIPYLKTMYYIGTTVFSDRITPNLLKYGKFYFEQVYKNIIKIPVFDLESNVYLKNIEIKSLNPLYDIKVVSFISSTVEGSNDTFMYEYMVKVEIDNSEIDEPATTNYGTGVLKYRADFLVRAEYTLVFADINDNEIRLKVKDKNIV